MKPTFSCADFTFPELPHDNVLELIKLLGIEAVDLGLFEDRSHHYPSDIASNPEEDGQRIASALDERDLEPADVFLQTGAEPDIAATNAPDDTVRERNRETFRKTVTFARALGCQHITGLPGVFHDRTSDETDWKRACEETRWRVRIAEEQDIVYSVEAHLGSILPDPETALQFIEDVPGLTLTLDYGHFIYQGIPEASIHPLVPHASHVHVRGGAPERLQTPMGENEIDFSSILSELEDAEYDGYICHEYVYVDWEGCNRTDNVSETIKLHELLQNALSE